MTDMLNYPAGIHRVLAEAVGDPQFKKDLLNDRAQAIEKKGIELTEEEREVIADISNAELTAAITVLEKQVKSVPPHSRTRAVMGCLGRVALYGGIAGALTIMALPSFGHSASHPDRKKACLANLRVLGGAIRMWEMDHEGITIESGMVVDRNHLPGSVGATLTPEYLKRCPRCKAGGYYRYDAETGTIYCSVHGTMMVPRDEHDEVR